MISNQATEAVWNLDLGPIKTKLMHAESGEGWSQQRADMVEVEYKRFLHLMNLYPNEQLAPSFDIDTFWHYHILDTMKYAADCGTVFGYFLHHYPYIGLRGEDDAEVHEQSGERMRELYEQTFATAYVAGDGQELTSTDLLSAYCAAPAKPAYCAAPGSAAARAYCAAPAQPSYCAAPARPASLATDSAYCAAPAKPAYCAAPATPASTAANTAAYCAAPARPAYCAAPAKPRATAANGTAYCAAPAKPSYCAAPASPGATAVNSAAYCAAPAKPAYCAAPARPATKAAAKPAYCAAPALPIFRPILIRQDRPANNAAYCAAPAMACAVNHKNSFGKDLLAVAA
jgi:hypothetical protein